MNTLEKQVWAAVFAGHYSSIRQGSVKIDDGDAVGMAVVAADNAVMALRERSTDLHVVDDLEMERRAELDIPEPEVEPGTWSGIGTDHVIRDVSEVKPLLEEAFKTSPPPPILVRFVRWLYGVTTFRLVDVSGRGITGPAVLGTVERVVDEFMGFDGGDPDPLEHAYGFIRAWAGWRNSDHIVEIFGGMAEPEEALAALVEGDEK